MQNLLDYRDDKTGQEADSDIQQTREKPIPEHQSDLSGYETRAESPSVSLFCPPPEDSSSEHQPLDNTHASKILKAVQWLRRDVTRQIRKDKQDMKLFVTKQISKVKNDIVQELGQRIQEVKTKTKTSLNQINKNLGANSVKTKTILTQINKNLGAHNVNVEILVEAATRSSVALDGSFNHKFMAGGTWSSIQDLCSAALNASQILGSEKQKHGMELGSLEELVLETLESNEIPFLEALCIKCNITFLSNAPSIESHMHRDKMAKSLGEYYKAQICSSQTELDALKLVHDFYGKNRNSQDPFHKKLKQSNSLAFMIYIWSLNTTAKSFKNELEIDCVGCSTLMDDVVEVHLGEIKTSQSALAHGITQLKLRLLALHAVMMLYETRKIVLTGHMFVAKRIAEKRWGNKKIFSETVGNNIPVKIEIHDQILSPRSS